ncbi:MAG: hypothetical protein AAF696_32325 [Bacteroidota bacterium]
MTIESRIHFDFSAYSSDLSLLDGNPIRCLRSIWIEDSKKKIFYPDREVNYDLIKNNPELREMLGREDLYLDQVSSLAPMCFWDTTVWDKRVNNCDSLLKLYRKKCIDQAPFYAVSFPKKERSEEIRSSHIFMNKKAELEIVFKAKMKVIEYENCYDFIYKKRDFESCTDCQPPRKESCPYEETSTNFVVLDELISLEACDEHLLTKLGLSPTNLQRIIIPDSH